MKNYTEADMTPWYCPRHEKPTHAGVYSVAARRATPISEHGQFGYKGDGGDRWAPVFPTVGSALGGYSWWYGGDRWGPVCPTIGGAAMCSQYGDVTPLRVAAWRGLARKPSAVQTWPTPLRSERLLLEAISLLEQAIKVKP